MLQKKGNMLKLFFLKKKLEHAEFAEKIEHAEGNTCLFFLSRIRKRFADLCI